MPEPFSSRLVQVNPVWSYVGQEVATTSFWFRPDTLDDDYDVADLVVIADIIGGTIKTQLQSSHPDEVSLIRTDARQYREDGSEVTASGITGNYVGTSASEILPLQCAAVVTVNTGFAGRAWRGRQYWPWFTETDNVGGTVSSGLRTKLLACQVSAIGSSGVNAERVLFSRARNSANPTTAYTARLIWGTQRRRRSAYNL